MKYWVHWFLINISLLHVNTIIKKKIFNLLLSHGYHRVYKGLSRWDDWYVKKIKINFSIKS